MGGNGDVYLVERRPHTTLKLDGAKGSIHVGGNGANGDVYLMSSDDCTTLKLDGANGNIHVAAMAPKATSI